MTASVMDRFWSKVDISQGPDGCWLWTRALNHAGYGTFQVGRSTLAHRCAYELLVGPIPDGLVLDHLCRVPRCVNPAHLEPVTLRENIQRGRAGAARREMTECMRGHPFTPENTMIDGRGRRSCKECHNRRSRETNARRIVATCPGCGEVRKLRRRGLCWKCCGERRGQQ